MVIENHKIEEKHLIYAKIYFIHQSAYYAHMRVGV